jgi:pimeloyl-ACP methyl ester carboxylesterase
LLALVAVPVVIAAIGALYEGRAVARDAQRFPVPGQLVDVGGRRLHLECIGNGSPIVVFEASGFSNSTSYRVARSAIAKHTRVCIYDRMGVGWSDPGPAAISAGMLAEELRRLQDAAGLQPPFIIVPGSIGGLTAEMFARRYPERVAGLVFLDAANSEALVSDPRGRALIGNAFNRALAAAACRTVGAAGRVGLMRLLDPWDQRVSEETARSAALMYGAKPWVMLCAMVRGARTTLKEFEEAPPLRAGIPITVLSAATREGMLPPRLARLLKVDAVSLVPALRETHQHLAERSPHGSWRIVPGSDHLIASSQPQAVVDAVVDLLAYVRGT